MIALIDADILCYRIGFAYEDADENLALWQADVSIHDIIGALDTSEYEVYIKGDSWTFRHEIDKSYKGERGPKPKHYQALYDFFVREHNAFVAEPGLETDDMLAIRATELRQYWDNGLTNDVVYNGVICSIDKDMLQVPGMHYNFVKKEEYFIDEATAAYNFWYQALVGDRIDNIKGCPGIGKVRATKILAESNKKPLPLGTHGEPNPHLRYYSTVLEVYLGRGETEERLDETCRLLYLLRHRGDQWQKPN